MNQQKNAKDLNTESPPSVDSKDTATVVGGVEVSAFGGDGGAKNPAELSDTSGDAAKAERSAQRKTDREQKRKTRKEERAAKDSADAEAEGVGQNWYKMDNAGLIFVPAKTRKWTSSFRVSCVMKSPVDGGLLQQAVNDLFPRFPSIMVHLRAGFFWNYLETAKSPPTVSEETLYPCQKFDVTAKRYLMRVMYYGNRIALEAFHAITDGKGAIVYLMSLVRRYLELQGIGISPCKTALNYLDLPTQDETEDSFLRIARHEKGRPYKERQPVHLKMLADDYGVLNVTHYQMSAAALKTVTQEYKSTIGQFLTAVLFLTLYRELKKGSYQKTSCAPIKIAVPVDLRKKFDSTTLRNFALVVNMELEHTEEHTFESILERVKEQYAAISKEWLSASVNKNVGTALNPLVRILPLPIKNIALGIGYGLYGDRLSTTAFSNIGPVETPKEFEEHVERVEFFLGPSRRNKVETSAVCFGDKLVFTIASNCKNTNIEKTFFTCLDSLGIRAAVDSNRRSCNV